MTNLSKPSITATSSPEEMADWLELHALASADGNSSLSDLARVLNPTGTIEEVIDERGHSETPADLVDRGKEATEELLAAASGELEDRNGACRGGYPFAISSQSIQSTHARYRSVYVFLLALATQGVSAGPDEIRVTELFEEVAAAAGRSYFGGEDGARHYQFGFPRRRAPAGFKAAMNDLCVDLGEGGGPRSRPTLRHQKDAKLDLVVWRPFPDGREGKIVAFGQCAAGADWPDKLSELDPRAFMGKWMRDPLTVEPSRMFFCPVRISRDQWTTISWDAGVLFDRCRIAHHAQGLDAHLLSDCERFAQVALRTQ